MLEFNKTAIKAKIYGTVYELRRPTVGEAQSYGKNVKGKSDEESGDALMGLLEDCGLPKEVSMDMETDHLFMLVDKLMPAKKK